MAALDAAFASVRQGGPAAVLLGGEAGVGKSRLVSEFGQVASEAGARVLTGGCLELGTDGLPFAPFTTVLRGLVHEMGADAVASMLPGRTTRGLARLLPELGEPDTSGEPGDRLVVQGVVRDLQGQRVTGAVVYVYHTSPRGW